MSSDWRCVLLRFTSLPTLSYKRQFCYDLQDFYRQWPLNSLFRCIFRETRYFRTECSLLSLLNVNRTLHISYTVHAILYITLHNICKVLGTELFKHLTSKTEAQIYSQSITAAKHYELQISWPDALVHTGLY